MNGLLFLLCALSVLCGEYPQKRTGPKTAETAEGAEKGPFSFEDG